MLIKSQVITQMSGSLGGLTGSHNRGGTYLRARSLPTNPNTTRQQNARAAMANAVNRWTSVLTSGARNAWTNYANNTPLVGPLGDPITLSGQQMYIRSQTVLANANLQLSAALTDLVAFAGSNNLGDFTPVAVAYDTGQTAEVTYDPNDDWANEDGSVMLIQSGRDTLNASVNYYQGPWQLRGIIAGDSVTPPTTPYSFVASATWQEEQRLYFRIRVLRADGRLSSPQVTSAVRPTP